MYSKTTQQYLNSRERKLANKLIDYQFEHDLTQSQMAKMLGIDLNAYLLVTFNHPKVTAEDYQLVQERYNELEEYDNE